MRKTLERLGFPLLVQSLHVEDLGSYCEKLGTVVLHFLLKHCSAEMKLHMLVTVNPNDQSQSSLYTKEDSPLLRKRIRVPKS